MPKTDVGLERWQFHDDLYRYWKYCKIKDLSDHHPDKHPELPRPAAIKAYWLIRHPDVARRMAEKVDSAMAKFQSHALACPLNHDEAPLELLGTNRHVADTHRRRKMTLKNLGKRLLRPGIVASGDLKRELLE